MRITKPFRKLAELVRGSLMAAAPARVADAAKAPRPPPAKSGYVSEFTAFMEHYLEEHPEVVRDQEKGWNIWWDHRVDLEALKKAAEDSVPTEGYYYGPPVAHKPAPSPSQGEGPDGGSGG